MTPTANAEASAPGPIGRPRPFRVEIHRDGQVVRVVPVGELDLATSGELESRLRALRGAAAREVVLDLREVEFIDSTGVRLIVAEDRGARSAGQEFAVISGPPAVQRVLEISGVGGHLRFRSP